VDARRVAEDSASVLRPHSNTQLCATATTGAHDSFPGEITHLPHVYNHAKDYKALHTSRLPYLADLIQLHITPKSTCSSSSQLLVVPHHNISFGSRLTASLPLALKFGIPYLFTSGNHSNCSPLSDVI